MAETKIYVPAQKTRRGVAGYRGDNVVVVDAETGKTEPAKVVTSGKGRKK